MSTKNNHGIQVLGKDGQVKAEQLGENQAILAWEGGYEEGDRIRFAVEKPGFYVIRTDAAMDESLVYLTSAETVYEIPFGEKKAAHNPQLFTGERHYLTLRPARSEEVSVRRNLAKNPMDQHGACGCYPHASANVETRGEAVFAARNAIDGVVANDSHGEWPYGSWGINRRADAEFLLEFGRPVTIDRIILYTRADFPHDSWWRQITISFSDGSRETVSLTKRTEPHVIATAHSDITWIRLGELVKAEDDPSPFPALTQIEVYGTESNYE